MSVLLFLIILLALVFVHEFGHFIVAKWTGMRVDEFAFGFPPRLYSKKVGETEYSINALPLGGYVSIYGESGDVDDKAKSDKRAFGNRPKWAQLATLSAGVIMNMIFAWVIFIITSYGNVMVSLSDGEFKDRATDKKVLVNDTYVGSPAQLAGLTTGSTILSIESKGTKISPDDADVATEFISNHINDPLKITYKKIDNIIDDTTITGVYGIVPDKKVIGISVSSVGMINVGALESVSFGSKRLIDMTSLIFDGLKTLVVSIGHGENVIKSLAGPVGIVKMVDQAENFGYKAVLTFTALLSINLAIFNALPLPALDGGRFLIVVGEAITRRRFSVKWLGRANAVSFALLILLLVLVTIKDINS